VVIGDLDIERVPRSPHEADTPTFIDADAVLSGTIAFERLEPIAGRDTKVVEGFGSIEKDELSERWTLKVWRERFGPEPFE
jgi:hypothetical protein